MRKGERYASGCGQGREAVPCGEQPRDNTTNRLDPTPKGCDPHRNAQGEALIRRSGEGGGR